MNDLQSFFCFTASTHPIFCEINEWTPTKKGHNYWFEDLWVLKLHQLRTTDLWDEKERTFCWEFYIFCDQRNIKGFCTIYCSFYNARCRCPPYCVVFVISRVWPVNLAPERLLLLQHLLLTYWLQIRRPLNFRGALKAPGVTFSRCNAVAHWPAVSSLSNDITACSLTLCPLLYLFIFSKMLLIPLPVIYYSQIMHVLVKLSDRNMEAVRLLKSLRSCAVKACPFVPH